MIGIVHTADFRLSEDDFHNDSVIEGGSHIKPLGRRLLTLLILDTNFLPQIDQGSIKLLDGKTWSIIDT